METKRERILELIRSGVFSTPLPDDFSKTLSPEEEAFLYHASKQQDLAHVLGAVFQSSGISLSKEGKGKFQKQVLLAYYRYEKLKYALERLTALLEEAEIPFLPLKGSVLREYYPQPWMRTSCDIDIFIRSEDLERAAETIVNTLGYTAKGQWTGERSLYSPDGIHLELHFYDEEDEEAAVSKELWDHAAPLVGCTYHMQLEWEYFYLYHVNHMAKHFSHGGCGVRPILDLAIMKNIPMAKEKRDEYLKRFGLETFAEAAERLSEVWFGEGEHTPLSLKMNGYILGAGLYGSLDNQLALEKSGKSKHLSGFFSHVWLRFDVIKHQYPVLLKHKWLYPFCQVARWLKLLFGNGLQRLKYHLRVNNRVSQKRVDEVSDLMESLRLK